MTKAAEFTLTLEPALRAEFIAAAEASRRPASQIMRELMQEFIQRQRDVVDHDAFLQRKVAAARGSIAAGTGRPNDEVEAEFAARRARIIDAA